MAKIILAILALPGLFLMARGYIDDSRGEERWNAVAYFFGGLLLLALDALGWVVYGIVRLFA
jgi:hypothetical protein